MHYDKSIDYEFHQEKFLPTPKTLFALPPPPNNLASNSAIFMTRFRFSLKRKWKNASLKKGNNAYIAFLFFLAAARADFLHFTRINIFHFVLNLFCRADVSRASRQFVSTSSCLLQLFYIKIKHCCTGNFLRTLKKSQKFKFALIYINSLKNDSFEILQRPFWTPP